jgi:type VII secretion-associated serine protease mycosin
LSRATARLVVCAFALTIPFAAAGPVAADEPELPVTSIEGEFASDRVVVRYEQPAAAATEAAEEGLSIVQSLDTTGDPVVVDTNGQAVEAVIAELASDPAVAWAEPDYVVELTDEVEVAAVGVNDPRTREQYSLDRMRVRDAWSLETGASNLIAVLDTGVQFSHPDLQGRLVPGYDFASNPNDANATDDNGHGTWVAGIIAAEVNDGFGVAGISWSDKILPVKVMNSNGTGITSDLTAGIIWAADHGAKVINMSVGGFPYSQAVKDAVDYAWRKGVVLVGAAGNNHREESFYPASYPNVVSVSATQADDEFTHWSSYGPNVDVSAPGASVLTTNCDHAKVGACPYNGDHIIISGTSFATPNTAGVVALIRARYPSYTPAQVVSRLTSTVDDLGYPGWDNRYGIGRVNAFRAVGGSPAPVARQTGDALEGNNAIASADRLGFDVTVRPSIYPAGDVDVFAIDVPAAGRVRVTVTAVTDTARPLKSSLPIDPVLRVYAGSGGLLRTVDNPSNAAATEVASVELTSTQRIFVSVANWLPNGNRTAYSISAGFTLLNGGFGDVATSPFLGDIIWLVDSGITAGCDVDRFCPRSPITRGQMAAFLVRAFDLPATSRDYFTDDESSVFEGDINRLAASGITGGCSGTRFCPGANVTRGQMAAFLVRAFDLRASSRDYFTDDERSIFEGDINRLAASGITGGCGGTSFCPSGVVTREQMAAFLHRAMV